MPEKVLIIYFILLKNVSIGRKLNEFLLKFFGAKKSSLIISEKGRKARTPTEKYGYKPNSDDWVLTCNKIVIVTCIWE